MSSCACDGQKRPRAPSAWALEFGPVTIRFAAQHDRRHSYHWTVRPHSDTEFVIARKGADGFHLTRHADGEFHLRQDTTNEDRTYPVKDTRPKDERVGAHVVLQIVISAATCTEAVRTKASPDHVHEIESAQRCACFILAYHPTTKPVINDLPAAARLVGIVEAPRAQLSIVVVERTVEPFVYSGQMKLYVGSAPTGHTALTYMTDHGLVVLEGFDTTGPPVQLT